MKQTERKNGARVAMGAAVALGAYLGLLALAALLLERGSVAEENAPLCAGICAVLAAFAGGKTAGWGTAKPLAPTAECLLAAFGAALLLGFLTNDALDIGAAARLLASMALGGALALPGAGKKRGKRPRRVRR